MEKAFFLENDYSIWSGVTGLWEDGELFLAAVVFFFSFVFPILKLLLLAWIWFGRMGLERRTRAVHALEELGRWSMLDVFAVAILIVATKLGPLAQVYPQPGVYWFAAGGLGLDGRHAPRASAVAAQLKRARRTSGPRRGPSANRPRGGAGDLSSPCLVANAGGDAPPCDRGCSAVRSQRHWHQRWRADARSAARAAGTRNGSCGACCAAAHAARHAHK